MHPSNHCFLLTRVFVGLCVPLGAYPAALLQCYAPAQDTIPALPFEVPAEWARIGTDTHTYAINL